jgi:hypothetical protein
MALKNYEYNGSTYQFDDSDVPDGAVEVKAERPSNKSVAPANKAVTDGDSKPSTVRKRG